MSETQIANCLMIAGMAVFFSDLVLSRRAPANYPSTAVLSGTLMVLVASLIYTHAALNFVHAPFG